jgi:hypothetical protein
MILADKRFRGFTAALIVLYIISVAFFYEFPFTKSIYRDMVGSYAAPAADYLHHKGIMQGRDEGGFYPKEPMTRAELLNLVLRVGGVDTKPLLKVPAETRFQDVPQGHWAASVVKEADKKGLIVFQDSKNGQLQPDEPITRAELAAAIVHTLKIQQGTRPILIADIKGHPYEQEINIMVSNGYASGYDNKNHYEFKPDQIAKREEVAEMWYKALRAMRWDKEAEKGGGK